jgi:hypothetical protein
MLQTQSGARFGRKRGIQRLLLQYVDGNGDFFDRSSFYGPFRSVLQGHKAEYPQLRSLQRASEEDEAGCQDDRYYKRADGFFRLVKR